MKLRSLTQVLPSILAALTSTTALDASAATLELDGVATIGRDVTPAEPTWREYIIRVRNNGAAPRRGTVEVAARDAEANQVLSSRAAFAVGSRSHTSVRTVVLNENWVYTAYVARLRDERGNVVAETPLNPDDTRGVIILDLDPSGRLRAMLQGSELPISRAALATTSMSRSLITTMPTRSPATGLPLLPSLPAGYAAVTLVVAPTSILTRLSPAELRTLGDWVLAGGALALSVDTPAALERSPFHEWLGGEVVEVPPPQELLAAREFSIVPPPEEDMSGGEALSVTRLVPTATARGALRGYRGAGLRDSAWGATASYGLGEIHLLAFAPALPAFATDPWVRRELETLATRAFVRRRQLAVPPGRPQQLVFDAVRRVLDPNQTVRWTLLVAVAVLIAYAVVAGPVNFRRAASKGRPLSAIPRLVFGAALVSAMIVGLGILSRGTESRARHLTLVELGAGVGRGAAARFRGFYTPRARELRVAASSSRAVLVADLELQPRPNLEVDARGLSLSNLRTTPWQTAVVRDDGFVNLGSGIALVSGREGSVVAVNRSGRDLVGVMIRPPNENSLYFHARIRDGERVIASEGHKHAAVIYRPPADIARPISLLDLSSLSDHLERTEPGTSKAWQALEEVEAEMDWWPSDVPVLLGQLAGGEGILVDSGMRLDSDRVFIRVVGYGGAE